MPTERKIKQVQELNDKLSNCSIAIATDPTGIDGTTMTQLRSIMDKHQVEYRMVKNTLAYISSDAIERPRLRDIIQGPTILAIGYDDPVIVAKAVTECVKSSQDVLAIKGALMGQDILDIAQIKTLANLPPKDQLIAMLLGQLQSPITQLVTVLNGPINGLANVLTQRLNQLDSQLTKS
jgi:large subunit ribosomal protein L10